jgi:hypothetical protein
VASQPAVEIEKHVREILNLDRQPMQFEALPATRHGVTFRNITLLPFLARVTELPKRPRTKILLLDRIDEVPISSATRKISASLGKT